MLGFASQNAAEQAGGGGGVGGGGAEQSDGKGTLKVKLFRSVWVVSDLKEQLQPSPLHDPVGPTLIGRKPSGLVVNEPPQKLTVLVANSTSQLTTMSKDVALP